MTEAETMLVEGLSRLVSQAQIAGSADGTIAAALMKAAATLVDGRTINRPDTLLAAVRAEQAARKAARP